MQRILFKHLEKLLRMQFHLYTTKKNSNRITIPSVLFATTLLQLRLNLTIAVKTTKQQI